MRTRRLLAALAITAAISSARTDPNNPTGTTGLILIDKVGHHIRFFDPKNWTEISNIEVGVNPHDIALSPDHKTAYVPIYGAGIYGRNPNPEHTIAIIDLTIAHRRPAPSTSPPTSLRTAFRSIRTARSTSPAMPAASCSSSIRRRRKSPTRSTPKAPATGSPCCPMPARLTR